jgi:hypothetical protein
LSVSHGANEGDDSTHPAIASTQLADLLGHIEVVLTDQHSGHGSASRDRRKESDFSGIAQDFILLAHALVEGAAQGSVMRQGLFMGLTEGRQMATQAPHRGPARHFNRLLGA